MCTTEDKNILDHEIQSSMILKPAFNCNRSWLYRFSSSDASEITYALRFKTVEVANNFQHLFNDAIEAVKKRENDENPIPNVPPPSYTSDFPISGPCGAVPVATT